jgi:hypothetical protein
LQCRNTITNDLLLARKRLTKSEIRGVVQQNDNIIFFLAAKLKMTALADIFVDKNAREVLLKLL